MTSLPAPTLCDRLGGWSNEITLVEWSAFMDSFDQALNMLGVPLPEQGDLKAIVERTRELIVLMPLDSGPAAGAEVAATS